MLSKEQIVKLFVAEGLPEEFVEVIVPEFLCDEEDEQAVKHTIETVSQWLKASLGEGHLNQLQDMAVTFQTELVALRRVLDIVPSYWYDNETLDVRGLTRYLTLKYDTETGKGIAITALLKVLKELVTEEIKQST